jgi:hypothetical protein
MQPAKMQRQRLNARLWQRVNSTVISGYSLPG